MPKRSIRVSLEFVYPGDEDQMRRALHGEVAVESLHRIKGMIDKWEGGDRVYPDDMIDRIKGAIVSALNDCGET
jgi:hypothetical protein